jgi:hypothetical protein
MLIPAPAGQNDLGTYTNFYILQQYSKPIETGVGPSPFGGKGPVQRKMIDRTNPDQSLLAQYALPVDFSMYRHPEVANYRPILSGRDDARYRRLISWMKDSLAPVPADPKYGITYELPSGMSPATAPATRAAAAPTTQAAPRMVR